MSRERFGPLTTLWIVVVNAVRTDRLRTNSALD